MTTYGSSSGIAIVAVRVLNFRSLANIEVLLNDLTVLLGSNNAGKTSFLDALFAAIGAGRKSLGSDDVRLAADESLAPKAREVLIDVMIRPVGEDGQVIDSYPEGSFWTNLWGTVGIASDDALNDFTAIRTSLKWSELRGEHVLERRFLKEWRAFEDWTLAATQDRLIGAGQLEPLAVHYVDAQRDLDEDLRRPGSFWRRLTEDLGLSAADVAVMETTLSGINAQIVDKSAILKHLTKNLAGLQSVVASERGGVSLTPVARKLRDLAKGVDVSFNTAGAQPFPLARHGMGTRSLASLLVFRAYASWRNLKASEGGDSVHSVLSLEEPESHLHPQAQRALFSHIKQVTGQRIVSTHSPYFAGQAPLEDLRLFFKSNGNTVVTQLDITPLKPDDLRKLQETVIETRGDILFSRGVVLFEGQTEEQALPIYASLYWGTSIHELGFCFVRVNGTDYFPFIWLLKALRIPWYVFSDGEPGPVAELDKALKKVGEDASNACANVVVLPNGNGFEEQLLDEGYLAEVEDAIDEIEGQNAYLDEYIATLHGKPKKKQVLRNYQGEDGRLLAAVDYLGENKTRMAKPVARIISALEDPARRIPTAITALFGIISADHGLVQAPTEEMA